MLQPQGGQNRVSMTTNTCARRQSGRRDKQNAPQVNHLVVAVVTPANTSA
jgi:hypothetical protein